ncbi:HAMP domain-containing sensor histidine kinase [Arcobacteraceae bacterium]|nr:HAMP domain-containing sensor histidine kinase [Arcobacteraceae bacterium]
MLKNNEKSIGNVNLISTFLVLMLVAFVVIMLSVNSKLDDFSNLQTEVKSKFLEDKKSDIQHRIHNINVLIAKYDVNDKMYRQKFVKEFVEEINKNENHNLIIRDLSKDMPYYSNLITDGEYYKNDKTFDEKTQKEVLTIEYLVLNKSWNWVISIKFSDDIINDQLLTWEEHLLKLIRDNIYVHISLLFLFSIALLLVMYVINRFANKTIAKCKNSIKVREKDLKLEINRLQQKLEEEMTKFDRQTEVMQKQCKMLALGEMLGNLSHQWKEPLTEISQTALSIKSKIQTHMIATDEDIAKLTNINNSSEYLIRTIEDFRVFLKADSLKIDFVVNEIIEKAIGINEAIIEKNKINIIKELDKEISIHNLSFGLLQAMVNIIYNAKDALKKIPENDRYIFITTKNHANSVEITITDTGNGIPEDVIGNIFKPYFTTKQKTYGTGLGLHMAYNIIEQNMSGKISVANKNVTYKSGSYIGASFSIILSSQDMMKC